MDDDEYVARLLAILTNPDPPDVDPGDPYRQSSDGIDRYDGFGTEVRVETIARVEGRYGEELAVAFVLDVPPGETRVPARATTRMPFDAEWRRLSEYDEPAAYAPVVAARVWWAAGDHVRVHRDGRRPPALPEPTAAWSALVASLEDEGAQVTETAPGRAEALLGDRMVRVVVEPGESFEVDTGDYDELPLLGSLDDDESFLVAYEGQLRGSTRPVLPPVRGRAREREARELHRLYPDAGWYAYTPRDPGRP